MPAARQTNHSVVFGVNKSKIDKHLPKRKKCDTLKVDEVLCLKYFSFQTLVICRIWCRICWWFKVDMVVMVILGLLVPPLCATAFFHVVPHFGPPFVVKPLTALLPIQQGNGNFNQRTATYWRVWMVYHISPVISSPVISKRNQRNNRQCLP